MMRIYPFFCIFIRISAPLFPKAAEHLQIKAANYKLTKNHQLSKMIIDNAVKDRCKTIKIVGSSFIAEWNLSDLIKKIMYKAEEQGISVIRAKD
jgi:hypothetical protein